MRILVIRPGALGDTLLTLPLLDALQSGFPEAEIEAMGNADALRLLVARTPLRAMSSFDRADMAPLFQPQVSVPPSLQHYLDGFDLILSFATPPGHVFAANLTRAARGRVLSWDPLPPAASRMHVSEHLQLPLRELGIAPNHGLPCLRLTAEDREAASQWWNEHGLASQRVAAIHPGSGSAGKNWPAARFAQAARWLMQERHLRTVLVEGPADELAVAAWQRNLGSDEYVLARCLRLPLLAGVLARSSLFVGNDSGVSHLAAALGTPTVAVFGPTSPEQWGPRGRCVRIVCRSGCAGCSPSARPVCARGGRTDAVSVADVLRQVDKLCTNG